MNGRGFGYLISHIEDELNDKAFFADYQYKGRFEPLVLNTLIPTLMRTYHKQYDEIKEVAFAAVRNIMAEFEVGMSKEELLKLATKHCEPLFTNKDS